MKKILITGASGFIGGFLVEEALRRNLDVYAAVRKTSSRQYLKDGRINFLYFDFEDHNALTHHFKEHNFDYIIHNAGLTQASSEEALNKVNATYLDNLLKSMEAAIYSPAKLTFISSLAAYGPADLQPDGIVSNQSSPKPVTKYGRSKLKGERILESQNNVLWNIIRPTAVYGPREHELFALFKTINNGILPKIGFSQQKLSFIYVEDLAKIILSVTLDAPPNQSYFAGDGTLYSPHELNNKIKVALNKRAIRITIPIFILSLIALINQVVSSLSGKYPILNFDKINELKVKSWSIQTDNLKNDIKFAPFTKLKTGIENTVSWYKQNNWL